ncbi:hypothetical protein [Pedobacter nyackensis]|uniref:Uncharacterized protein n=1 Tax=Pedobacter nyackensis TaxID=475255 RepID=A0A1W1ZTQ2_9SPHI|nr:hypothetical protein [Pedobacter nyackensis]SMC51747.1 hypothetical protein SAMN04488101_10144 [Pedobacter nyackensis]
MGKRLNAVLAVLILALIIWMVKGTFMQPGVNDLKGGFKEIAHYRNENNTGPIQHVFSVTVKDTTAAEMELYGNFMPHHKGGNTKVYFFLEGTEVPDKLYAGKVNFDPQYNQNCIALYEKTAMGNTSMEKRPFN